MGYFWLQHTLHLVTVTMTENDYSYICIIKNNILISQRDNAHVNQSSWCVDNYYTMFCQLYY